MMMEREGGPHLRVRRAASLDVMAPKDAGCAPWDHGRMNGIVHHTASDSSKSCRAIAASNSLINSRGAAELSTYTVPSEDGYAGSGHSNKDDDGPALRVRPQGSFNSDRARDSHQKEGFGGKPPLRAMQNSAKFEAEEESYDAPRTTRMRACAVLAPGAYKETAVNGVVSAEDLNAEESPNDAAKWVAKLLRFVQKNGQELLHLVCNR
jgi:hypothetical protein